MERLPVDLRKVFAANPKAKPKWDALTAIARRDFVAWIESAKQPETRKRRVESVPSRLAAGKQRICCFAVVPMNLYKAIGELPKAKTAWKGLTADEKRDFVDWINKAKDKAENTKRIEKVCAVLLRGKRHP